MVPGVKEFLQAHPEFADNLPKLGNAPNGREFRGRELQPAVDFIQQTRLPLYCGEYGAIDHAEDFLAPQLATASLWACCASTTSAALCGPTRK